MAAFHESLTAKMLASIAQEHRLSASPVDRPAKRRNQSPAETADEPTEKSGKFPAEKPAKSGKLSFSICHLLQLDVSTEGTETETDNPATEKVHLEKNSDLSTASTSTSFDSTKTDDCKSSAQSSPCSGADSSTDATAVCTVWNPQMDSLFNTPWMSPDLQRRFLHDRLYTRRIGHPYQSRAPAKHKKPRTSFNKEQILELEERFRDQKYLASSERATLAKALDMSDSQVKTWFQNRRTKWRRQAAEDREEQRRRQLQRPIDINDPPAFMARPDVTF